MPKYKVPAHAPSRNWTVSTEWKAPTGVVVDRGTELSIKGVRGRFRFYDHVVTETGAEWLSVIGGVGRGDNQQRQFRFFRPDRVKVVHRKQAMMSGSEARALVNAKNRQKRAG